MQADISLLNGVYSEEEIKYLCSLRSEAPDDGGRSRRKKSYGGILRSYGGGKKTESSSSGGSTKKRRSGGCFSRGEEEPVRGDAPLVLVGGGISKKRSYGGEKKTERSSSGGLTKKRRSGGCLCRGEEEPVRGDAPLMLVGGVVSHENFNRHFAFSLFFQVETQQKGVGAGFFLPRKTRNAQTAKAQSA
ncbi:hypothetical protein Bca4012_038883 [Brassica carinata]